MKTLLFVLILSLSLMAQNYRVKEINLLTHYGLDYNAAGPLLVRVDSTRNRIIVPHTISSALSIIDGVSGQVVNIPLLSRVPQHVKDEALFLNEPTGMVYLIGDHCLHMIDPQSKTAREFRTELQYEMAVSDPADHSAYLVGREDPDVLVLDLTTGQQKKLNWVEHSEPLVNLNQTPPPPIRKIFYDRKQHRLIALDGFTSTIHLFNAKKLKSVKIIHSGVQNIARWHLAGYDQQRHALYLVSETARRKVTHALRFDLLSMTETAVPLPDYSEAVGVTYHPGREEVYIPYDNHPSVHVVDFGHDGALSEIKVPLYGNDATAIDMQNDRLYVACWAYGEIEIIDLRKRKFMGRFSDLHIIPHMFTMDFNPRNRKLYFPKGATAVNGNFGSAVTTVDVSNGRAGKIYTGWAPVDLVGRPGDKGFLVFNSEDEMAAITADGKRDYRHLPFQFPHQAVTVDPNHVYLSYGPHQSYWPTVYIWGARDGIAYIDLQNLRISDRRIPRLAQRIMVDKRGKLYALQNSWGAEKQFISVLIDEVREWQARDRIVLPDTVNRETIQRGLSFDPALDRLYLIKTGEKDALPGRLQIIDPVSREMVISIQTGSTPTDLIFDKHYIYVTNFDSNNLLRVNKEDFTTSFLPTGSQPLKMVNWNDDLFLINHGDNTLQRIGQEGRIYILPAPGRPDGLFVWDHQLVISLHNSHGLRLLTFNPRQEAFREIFQFEYPYGSTGFDTNNSSFYLRGQFADCVYDLCRFKEDRHGQLWLTDFLSGRVFIMEQQGDNK